jgi:uncharacterized membrane protein YgcG
MEYDVNKEARKQYFGYFRIWFIILAVTAVLALFVTGIRMLIGSGVRKNYEGEGRVFDNADVLTDAEEAELAAYIAECEDKYHFDIVLVTINEDVETQGYWDSAMQRIADDFYDNGKYGYNKVYGDGILLLDNWYEDSNGSQKGTWLSTCGKVYEYFDDYDIDAVLNRVDRYIDKSPYNAYKAAITKACVLYKKYEKNSKLHIPVLLVILVPIVTAVGFALANLSQTPAKDTTTSELYVDSGSRKVNVKSDDFIRKSVSSVRVSSSSSGSSGRSGGSSGGHGGGHVSSGGVSHGGGGHHR